MSTSLLDVLAGSPQPVVVTTVSPEPAKATAPTHVAVVPYNACLDPQADTFLPWLWKKMQDDDLVDYYFPGQRDTGFASFVRLFSGDAQVAMFKTADERSQQWEDRLAGFITWTPSPLSPNAIIAGFIFFRKFWDHHTTDDAAHAAFSYWFRDRDIQVVLGVCPSEHVVALRYNKRIGLREMGRIPMQHVYKGKPCDAVLVGVTREDWEAKCQQQ